MGGVDKGLQTFNGMPLAQHTLTRLKMGAGLGHIMVNANRNLPDYEAFGAPVYPDTLADYAGPLAGFLTGFAHCQTPYLVTTPCDTPLLPLDLVTRLSEALVRENADIAMAAAPEIDKNGATQVRTQPVFCLLRTALQPSLMKFTQEGGRKIDAWTALHNTVIVPFDRLGDNPRAFFNANTLAELRQLEST
jgi:molybdopterin-guanine dinucleotide biosynthesis protein A